MSSSPSTPPLVAWAGLLLGLGMLALSVAGILWRIDALGVGVSLITAAAGSAALARHFRRRPVGIPALLVLVLLVLVALPTVAAFAPPHDWDEVAYTAALPRDYARAGSIFYNADHGPFSAFPANYEALTTAALVLVGHVAPARLLNVALALGLAVIAVHLGTRLGVARPVASLAAVLVLAAPALQGVAVIVKNDIANAFFQALVLLALADYAERAGASRLALAGFFLGTAVGTKYSSLQFALCLAPLALVLAVQGSRDPATRLRHAGAFAGAAVLAALPWYARNAAAFANPFYPFFNQALGAANGFTAEDSALAREMFDGLTGYSARTGSPGDFLRHVLNGFGWMPVLLALPGAVLAVVRRRSPAAVLLGAAFLLFGVLTFFAGYWLPRYFLSLLVLSAAFAAVCLGEVVQVVRALRERPRAAAVATALAVLVGAVSLRQQVGTHGPLIASFYGKDRVGFLEANVGYWTVADWINRHTPAGDRVGLGLDVQPFFYLERPYFNIHPLTEKGDLQARETGEDYLQAFRSLDLQWVAFRRWQPGPRYRRSRTPHLRAFIRRFDRAILSLQRDGAIEPVARLGDVRVYRVRTRPGATRGS